MPEEKQTPRQTEWVGVKQPGGSKSQGSAKGTWKSKNTRVGILEPGVQGRCCDPEVRGNPTKLQLQGGQVTLLIPWDQKSWVSRKFPGTGGSTIIQ